MMKKALVLALIPSMVLATAPADHAKLAKNAATKAVKAERAAVQGRLAQLLNAGQSTVANTYGFVKATAEAYPKTAKVLALITVHEAGRRGDLLKLLNKVPFVGKKAVELVGKGQGKLDKGLKEFKSIFVTNAKPARPARPTSPAKPANGQE